MTKEEELQEWKKGFIKGFHDGLRKNTMKLEIKYKEEDLELMAEVTDPNGRVLLSTPIDVVFEEAFRSGDTEFLTLLLVTLKSAAACIEGVLFDHLFNHANCTTELPPA